MVLLVPGLKVVRRAVVASGRVLVVQHPPHGCVAEELEAVGSVGLGLGESCPLVCIDIPVL